ncbi:MarR family transcriptional regulator [uncultured Martelella sp.]|uniref:MarR family winged helix-turn-helix transcriptional regulator n=1 Tax=uncultured Martelella sp. TaxID=392331 RepID=UPI0029C6F3F5|nr:MarR family transcriptional regulator [uncultured Martelella sp.]
MFEVPYEFTDSIPYLLNRVGVRLGERFSSQLLEHDVTLSMYRVLAVLRQRGEKTLSELAELVSVEVSTLSRLVGQLVRRGLVSRVRPVTNGRIVQINLTEKGTHLADRLMPVAAMYEETAVDGLDPETVVALKRTLRHINRNISKL